MSGIVGFPTRWELAHPSPVEILRLWPAAPLRAILSVTGLTIHQLVQFQQAKAVTFQLFKAWREVERREDSRWAEKIAAYWEWVRFYVGETA